MHDLWCQLIPMVTILNNKIVLDSFLHYIVTRDPKIYYILTNVKLVYASFFNLEENILGYMAKKLTHLGSKNESRV